MESILDIDITEVKTYGDDFFSENCTADTEINNGLIELSSNELPNDEIVSVSPEISNRLNEKLQKRIISRNRGKSRRKNSYVVKKQSRELKLWSISLGEEFSMDIVGEQLHPTHMKCDSSSYWGQSSRMVHALKMRLGTGVVQSDVDGSFLFGPSECTANPSNREDIIGAIQTMKLEYLMMGINRELSNRLQSSYQELDVNRCLYLLEKLNSFPIVPCILFKNPEVLLITKIYTKIECYPSLQRKARQLFCRLKSMFNCQNDDQLIEIFLNHNAEFQKVEDSLPEGFHLDNN